MYALKVTLVDEGKPKMILPSAQIKAKQSLRHLFPVNDDESGLSSSKSEVESESAADGDLEYSHQSEPRKVLQTSVLPTKRKTS